MENMEDFKKFETQIQKIAEKIKNQKQLATNEEATKQAFILPFFQALGYDIFNLEEVFPEYGADFQKNKKPDCVDYCILKGDSPILLIECKLFSKCLENGEKDQLKKYFSACVATNNSKFAILTNGQEYKFYADLDKDNIMDDEPFWQFSITEIKDTDMKQLYQFRRTEFNQEEITENAKQLKYAGLFYEYMKKQFDNPDDDFANFILGKISKENKTEKRREILKSIIKNAFNQIIEEKINKHNTIKQENNQDNNITDSENSGKLIVTFNDTKIQCENSVDTFVETIEKIGFKKVMDLNIRYLGYNIVNTQLPNTDYSFKKRESYFIITHFNNPDKRKILQNISDKLNLNLKVELLEDK
ncbi:MAG: type I restriction enzyme HsdR N-terminal domain-containing protein [Neisseriaceae bacterium]|nr:type I restriction enzyme HsdR N-terminal domain-containing protein [Neisseriaceae bacterium]